MTVFFSLAPIEAPNFGNSFSLLASIISIETLMKIRRADSFLTYLEIRK